LIRTRNNKYYLCLLSPLKMVHENQMPTFSDEQVKRGAGIIALDPGERTFVTGYDPSGKIHEVGWSGNKSDYGRIHRLCLVHDSLQSRCMSDPNTTHQSRYRLQRAMRRIRIRIRNLVDELHKWLAKWLCENYNIIILPHYQTSQMLMKSRRRIGSKTARAMATWAHTRFKNRLLEKTREYSWCACLTADESYTSITCNHCGYLNNRFTSKVFRCASCHQTSDRDAHGARGILIRFLSKLEANQIWW